MDDQLMSVRKIKYGNKVTAVSTVMADIAEEIIDLTTRIDGDKVDASAQLVEQHQHGLVERVQIRAELLYKLSKLL
jgi:hypothetical protein